MTDRALYELAALDAAGALEAAERRDYEQRLAQATPEERVAVAELYDGAAAALLAAAGGDETPAADVRDKVITGMVTGGRFVTVRAGEGEWRTLVPGAVARTLVVDAERRTTTLHVRIESGAVYPAHHHAGPEDTYVLSGEILIQGQRLRQGDFHHADGGSDHDPIICEQTCELLVTIDASDYFRS